MKKLFMLITLCVLMFCTTACTKNEYTITIDKNNKVTIEEVEAFNLDGFIAASGVFGAGGASNIKRQMEADIDKAIEPMLNKGYDAEKYDEDGYLGIKRSKSYEDFQSVKLPEGFVRDANSFSVKNTVFKKVYQVNLKYDPALKQKTTETNPAMQKIKSTVANNTDNTSVSIGEKSVTDGDKEVVEQSMENIGMKPIFSLTLKIPYPAKSTNALKKDDKACVYSWDLDYQNPTEISAVYEETRVINIIVALVLLLLIGVAIYHAKNDTPSGL